MHYFDLLCITCFVQRRFSKPYCKLRKFHQIQLDISGLDGLVESFEEKLCFPNSGKDEKPGPAVVAYAMPLFFVKKRIGSLGGLRFEMDSIHHIWILQVRSMDAKWPSL